MSGADALQTIYAALAQGRTAEAEAALAPLLVADPNAPELHRAMAAVAQRAGRPEQAVTAMRTAVDVSPETSPETSRLHFELGLALTAAGRPEDALASLRRATELQPDAADAWYVLGMTLYGLRRDAEALPAFRRAHTLAPEAPQIAYALAETLYARERHDEALALYARLLAMRADDPMLHLRVAQCLRREGMPARAREVVQEALRRFPEDPLLWLETGWIAEDVGDADAARAAYARAQTLRPDWSDPVALRIVLDGRDTPDDLLRIAERMAADPNLPVQSRAYLHHALGKRCDRLGEFAAAATHWRQANRLRRSEDGGLDRAAHAADVDATIAAFDRETIAALRANAISDPRPIFVVGMPRSGSTLIERMLAAHPQAHGCGEVPGIVRIAEDLPQETGLQWPQQAARLDPAWLGSRAQRYLQTLCARAPADALRLVDKQPYNVRHLGLIAMLLAEARVVWCRRDPRDVALSIYSESFAPSASYATDLDDIAFVIAEQERLMRHWRAVLPLPMLDVHYEDVIADPEAQLARLLDFAGLPWDARCLEFHTGAQTVQTLSRWQVRRPLHAGSLGRWRNYPQWFGGG